MKSPDLELILVETYWNTIHPWQVVFVISPISFGCAKNLPRVILCPICRCEKHLHHSWPSLPLPFSLLVISTRWVNYMWPLAFFIVWNRHLNHFFLWWIFQWFNHFQSSVNMLKKIQRISLQSPPTKKYSGCHWFLSNFFFQWITFSFGQQKILRMSLVFI